MGNTKPSTSSPNAVLFDNGAFLIGDIGGQVGLFSPTGTELLKFNNSGIASLGTSKFVVSAVGLPTLSNNITLVGQGFPLIVATSVQTQTNTAPTTVSFTPPAVAGTYRISSFLDISTGTTITFKNILGYTDAAGTAQTDVPVWERQNNATMLQNPTVNTADRFVQPPYLFSVDNSGTAITLGDNTGTYTTCIYGYTVILERLI